MRDCYIVGLTGGSGSGKSEAARILAGFGAAHINVDKEARVVMDEPDALIALERELGSLVIGDDGKFARKRVADIAFRDKNFLSILTRISHAFITRRILDILDDITKKNPGSVIVIDAPIPIERGFLDKTDEVWVMKADYDIRLNRIITRDGIGEEEAITRINAQLSDYEYEKLADIVILNNGAYAELKEKLSIIWENTLTRHIDHGNNVGNNV